MEPGIDSEESTPPAYVAWLAGTTNRVIFPVPRLGNRFLGSLKGLQIQTLQGFPALAFSLQDKLPQYVFKLEKGIITIRQRLPSHE
jgi:hypothetical protein